MAMTISCGSATLVAMLLLATGAFQAAQGRALFATAPAPAPTMSSPMYIAQPALPYTYSTVEPYIDARTMQIHWTKHTATYFENLNKAIVPFPALQSSSLLEILLALNTSAIPMNISKTVRNNAGGAWNHLCYFKTLMAPTAMSNMSMNDMVPEPLAGAINASFGNYTAFKTKMGEAGLGVFGSGFAWLTMNTANKTLAIESTPNQDNPIMKGYGYSGNAPLLALDVWEHAYYLKHQNVRAEYIKDWWMVVNWTQVNTNYQAAMQGNIAPLTSYSS